MRKIPALVVGVLILPALSASAQSKDVAGEIRALYESAAYDDALAKLASAGDEPGGKVEQYRAFCLFALGRQAEATAAVDKAVRADPDWVPPSADASPRVRAFYSEERRRLLPDIVRGIYTDAKAAYMKKDYAAADAGFKRVMALVGSTGPEPDGALNDLALLAHEFADLSEKAPSTAAPKPSEDHAAPVTPAKTSGPTRGPVAISETFPAWQRTAWPGNREGVIRVDIDEEGAVVSASILKTTDPLYDRQLLDAARLWRYEPALRAGQAVRATREVAFRLNLPEPQSR